MRGPLPLNDDDFAEIRKAVLARIERRRRTPWGELMALAASVVVAILSVVVARQPMVMPLGAPHYTVIPTLSAAKGRDLVAREARRPPTQVPRYARHDKPRKRPRPTQLARIEIHTADPDIRIIWITNQEAP